ncbi:MAG: hypothetical protein JW759_03690 [Candidatus Coatesbacteria bacterium]|nr:hypothetical protein [Candidatus Coatesbacteria bacterium]
MRTCLSMLVIVNIILVGPVLCPAHTIDVFPFEQPGGASRLQVGPSGDVWFSLSDPARLMRISNDAVECAYDSGVMDTAPYHITITPDGVIWLEGFRYIYSPDLGVYESDIQLPEEYYCFYLSDLGIADADCRMFVTGFGSSMVDPGYHDCRIYEVGPGIAPKFKYAGYYLDSILVVSARECWTLGGYAHGGSSRLWRIDLDAGTLEAEYREPLGLPSAKDSEDLLWLNVGPPIGTFDGQSYSVFAEGDEHLWYHEPVLAADGAVWSVESTDASIRAPTYFAICRFADGQKRSFTVEDGLLSNWCESPVIDYDGRSWVLNRQFVPYYPSVGLSRITDGGWPPMRLMLNRLDTPESLLVEAQVINNGPVVGVDVYIALQLGDRLLFWPGWGPTPCALQVNLCPGHNQTTTILELPRSQIPPGSYTFWGCMTGRNTQKLIGPLDRKFESVTVEIN